MKRKKRDVELDYDYDDPFIDDEEQTDEEVPEEYTTARGGFYINTGKLKLKLARKPAHKNVHTQVVGVDVKQSRKTGEVKSPVKSALVPVNEKIARVKKVKVSKKEKNDKTKTSKKKKDSASDPLKEIAFNRDKKTISTVKTRRRIVPAQLPDTTEYDKKVFHLLQRTESGWKCSHCDYCHDSKANLLLHAESHIQDFHLKCVLCDNTFTMKRNLKQHILRHHAIPKAKLEGKKFEKVKKSVSTKKILKIEFTQMCDTTEYDLKVTELISKSNEGLWVCKNCPQGFETKAKVLKHAEQHLEGYQLPCKVCDKTFSMKRNLKQHIYNVHREKGGSKKEKTIKKPSDHLNTEGLIEIEVSKKGKENNISQKELK